MSKFKVGDKIRRVSNAAPWAPIGYETVVTGVPEDLTYTGINGDKDINVWVCDWELIQDGPVRTVTRREIVPGFYGDAEVAITDGGEVQVKIHVCTKDPSRLLSASMILSQIAEALDDKEETK